MAASTPTGIGTDVSNTVPSMGIATSSSEVFSKQAVPPLRKATTPAGASSQISGLSSAKRRRLASTAEAYVAYTDVGSLRRSSAQYRENSAGWGSQGGAGDAPSENPKVGASLRQGIGTRHPSRPNWVPEDRAQMGSWRTSGARSSTSGRPSSSPWYTNTVPGSASCNSAAARARRIPRSTSTAPRRLAAPIMSEGSAG